MKKSKIYRYSCLLFILFLFIGLVGCVRYICIEFVLEPGWETGFEKEIESDHFIFYISKEEKLKRGGAVNDLSDNTRVQHYYDEKTKTGYIIYREDKIEEGIDVIAQEQFYKYITELFGMEPKEKIIYMKCRDYQDIERATRSAVKYASGLATLYRNKDGSPSPIIFSVSRWDNHELVHVLGQLISGGPIPAFFDEGLAVAYQIDPSRNCFIPISEKVMGHPPLHVAAKTYAIINSSFYIPFDEIITSENFRALQATDAAGSFDGSIAYDEAGSFVRYLIDVYGLEKFFQFLKLTNYGDSKSEIKKKFLKVYSFSVQKAEKQWLKFLEENY